MRRFTPYLDESCSSPFLEKELGLNAKKSAISY